MVAAKPILTMLTGEGSRLVDEAGCGFTAQSSDFRQLADNIKRMSKLDESALKMMGQSAKEYSDREFNRDKLITQLENLFDELIDQSVMGRKIGVKKKVLITGGSGFVGSTLLDHLLSLDRHYLVTASRHASVDSTENLDFFQTGDIGPETEWSRALNGC
nr:NAD-dependent epimerase/dehydratase family protein [uncultured Desulfuromusa sp.]